MSQKHYGTINSQLSPNMSSSDPNGRDFFSKKLAESITTNMYTINNGTRSLDQTLKIIGTSRDSQVLRDKVHVTQMSCNEIIVQLTKDLQKFASLSRSSDKAQKLQSEKLTNSFKETVQAYSDLQHQLALKMKSNPLPTQVVMDEDNPINSDLVENEQRQLIAQRHFQNQLEFEQSLLLERESNIKQIEGDIINVNEIMRELGSLVHQHSDYINSIEYAIENVHVNVESGTEELKKGAEYQPAESSAPPANFITLQVVDESDAKIISCTNPIKRRKRNCGLLTVAIIAFLVFLFIMSEFFR